MFDKDENYKQIKKRVEDFEKKTNNNILKYAFVPIILLVIFTTYTLNVKPNNNLEVSNKIIINEGIEYDSTLLLDVDGKWVDSNELEEIYNIKLDLVLPKDLILARSGLMYVKNYTGDSTIDALTPYTILNNGYLVYTPIDVISNQVLEITISKDGKRPLRCLQIIEDEDIKPSIILNTEVKIIGNDDYYRAILELNNLYIEIETREISQDDLIKLIESIISGNQL